MPSPLRVLILEDNPSDAELMLHELRAGGFEPTWSRVESPADFLAALDTPLDVILADHSLPQFDAPRALALLQERGLSVPFLVVSGTITDEHAVECMKRGASDYLLKDRLGRLGLAVRRALEERHLRDAKDQAEGALRESEARGRLITHHINDGIVLLDLEGKILFANPRALELTGYTADEALGQPLAILLTPEARSEVEGRLSAVRRGEDVPPVVEFKLRRRDGRRVWVEANVTSIAGSHAGPARLAVIRDITQRRLAETALRESEERFRSAFDEAAIGMAIQALDGRYLRVNLALCEMLGYTATELLATSYQAITHPEDRQAMTEGDRRLLAGETRSFQVGKRYLHRDGHQVWVLVSVSLVRDRTGTPLHYIAQAQDMTAVQRAQEVSAGLEAQLHQAQKMEAIGRLAGGVAHDFNNLLTVIIGRSELLRGRLPPDGSRRRDVDLIQQAATRAAALTQQLLAFSRKQVLEPRVLDLNETVTAVQRILRRLIGEDIRLTTEREPALGAIRADRTQLEQVILNLAVNARDAMPQGGTLVLRTENAEVDEGFCHDRPGLRPGAYVKLTVADTGVGMDAHVRAHLFEPFFTTKAPDRGTGLGLATVYGIVKQSGGWIGVESAPGAGATFTIYLPRVDAAPERFEESPLGPVPGGDETLLLVEDNADVRTLSRDVLEEHGYRVLEAATPAEALAMRARYVGPIELLITDVVMPGMSGSELARRLTEASPGLRVLYMSGYTDDAIVHHGVLDPGVVLLRKPFGPDALARKVRAVLDSPAGAV